MFNLELDIVTTYNNGFDDTLNADMEVINSHTKEVICKGSVIGDKMSTLVEGIKIGLNLAGYTCTIGSNIMVDGKTGKKRKVIAND